MPIRTNWVDYGDDARSVPAAYFNAVGTFVNETIPKLAQIFSRLSVLEAGGTGPNAGPRGIPGKSAYDIAVEGGFDGTEAEWVDSLNGSGADVDASQFATAAQGAKADSALQPSDVPAVLTLAAFWDGGQGHYEDATGAEITSVPAGTAVILFGGTVAQRDAQSWLPSRFAHVPEALKP